MKIIPARWIPGVLCLLVIAALALVAGCGEDATATPVPTPAATPTEAPAPAPTATPLVFTGATHSTSPTPKPTATRVPAPTATPAPEPTPPPAADPSDAYFALDRVLEISIEIAPEDWDTLRHQTRTFEDLLAEIEEYNLSRPFADIYTWFSATVTIDGETRENVGVRKKGFLGSQSDTKPSLKLRYDKYVDDQSLGGVMQRMTLNNSKQDPSMINTCLAYQVFAAAGLPSSRCNFATVTVNGKDLGLYVHVEEIKKPMLARHFDSAEGNLYEGTISDFTTEQRGTFEKKTNEDEADWSDIDAVVAALQDPSPAGLNALDAIVDRERFLSYWATEVLTGHWDSYSGNNNNYHFYREPGGFFVFIPWGVDDVFHLKDDPNIFDNVSSPPPSVLANGAIANRLYNDADGRAQYVDRLRELLDTIWDEEYLLENVDRLAAVVQENALPENREAADKDAERVRKFILKRRGEILADLTPEPPDWPEPGEDAATAGGLPASGAFEVKFQTAWGTSDSANPLAEGTVYELNQSGEWAATAEGDAGATAGLADPQQAADIGVEDAALITVMGLYPDFTIQGVTLWLPVARLSVGAELAIGVDAGVGGAIWQIPPGGSEPEGFIPITGGGIALTEAAAEPGATIAGILSVSWGRGAPVADAGTGSAAVETGFATTWGSADNINPFEEGKVDYLMLDGIAEPVEGIGVIAGPAGELEALLLPGAASPASITVIRANPDGSLEGLTFVLSPERLTPGAVLDVGAGELAGGAWSTPPGSFTPDEFFPFTEGRLEFSQAASEPGAAIAATFSGAIGLGPLPPTGAAQDPPFDAEEPLYVGLVINEVAAKGDPLDWFELYNALDNDPIGLFGLVVADDLADPAKRVAFPPGTEIGPGEYLRFELDKDGWPGFALGGDEELGIWTLDGTLLAMVDWDEGQSGEGQSYARIPDITGGFQTVNNITPGAPNQ